LVDFFDPLEASKAEKIKKLLTNAIEIYDLKNSSNLIVDETGLEEKEKPKETDKWWCTIL